MQEERFLTYKEKDLAINLMLVFTSTVWEVESLAKLILVTQTNLLSVHYRVLFRSPYNKC